MSGKVALFLLRTLRLYPGLKLSFEHNSFRKSLFLGACFWWNATISLREVDQSFTLHATIGYVVSYLEFLVRHFKVTRLHVIPHYAAGALRAHSDKAPDYCYMIGRGPKSCLRGHVTGLFFCVYVKLFLFIIFECVVF